MNTPEIKKSFFDKGFFPLIMIIIFSIIFVGLYISGKESALQSSGIALNPSFSEIFKTYGLYVGFAVGLIALAGVYILFLIKLIFGLRKFTILNPFVYIIVFGGLFWFGYFLVYFEPRYTDVAKGIIDFFGKPLMYSSSTIIILSIIWFAFLLFKKVSGKK